MLPNSHDEQRTERKGSLAGEARLWPSATGWGSVPNGEIHPPVEWATARSRCRVTPRLYPTERQHDKPQGRGVRPWAALGRRMGHALSAELPPIGALYNAENGANGRGRRTDAIRPLIALRQLLGLLASAKDAGEVLLRRLVGKVAQAWRSRRCRLR